MKSFLANIGIGILVFLIIGAWLAAPISLVAFVVPFALWLAAARRGRQALLIAWTGLSTLPQRLGASSVIVVGIAGVVGVLVALLAMAGGFATTVRQAGADDAVIVLRSGADSELSSGFDRDTATLLRQLPGIVRDALGRPVASSEIVLVSNVPKKSTGTDANVEFRGVSPEVWTLRPNVRVKEGRPFEPGRNEIIVGKGALAQFTGLEPGSIVLLSNQSWKVVGVFESGDAHESELWADVESLAAASRRNAFQSVTLRLREPAALADFQAAAAADPRLKVDVQTTREYYNKQSEQLTQIIRILGLGVAVIMAVGAVFGALNTMYSAVAARAREIATLRALGFTSPPVIAALLIETLLLALVGGLLGACVAWAVFHGYTASTLGGNFSQVVFQFQVSPALMLLGLQWALAIGFLGGLFPALYAARLPVTVALREL
ncbi:MAG: FtsX-like permease family protein [Gammaproteobacteria bacterium]|nr:FtsX-like permease family protein [Gammaproteobacteria bacterium]